MIASTFSRGALASACHRSRASAPTSAAAHVRSLTVPNFSKGEAKRCAYVTSRRGMARATVSMTMAASKENSSINLQNAQPTEEILNMLRAADAFCFDVDSTVCTDEGIDELAGFLGKGEEVAAWTTKAMGGGIPFQDALKARLDIMNPSRQDVDTFLSNNPPSLSPGIDELVQLLQQKGKVVYLVSGGFTQMIEPVADLLGIPRKRVFANTILFNEETGAYTGFDKAAFTSRAGGKAAAIKHIKAENGYTTVIMMGDGATDLEARQPGGAVMFVGYGGVAYREGVAKEADWYMYSFEPLSDELKQL